MSEFIARDLAAYIVDNELEEGAILPNEREMCEAFNVGRMTLREAIRLLESRGVLTVKAGPKGGPVVRRPRGEDLGSALKLMLQFSGGTLADVLEARAALEPIVTRLAAPRITAEGLEVMDRSIEAMAGSLENHEDEFLRQNKIFHEAIGSAAGSVILHAFLDGLTSIADGVAIGVRYPARSRRDVVKRHTEIRDALAAGNEDAAEDAMRRHIQAADRYWRREYPHLFAQPVRWLDSIA